MKSAHAIVFCGDQYHPAATLRAGLSPLARSEGVDFDWVEDTRGWDPHALGSVGLVLLAKSNVVSETQEVSWMSPEVEAAFDRFVRAGGGLLVLHSGIVGYAGAPVFRALAGGTFLKHPPACPVSIQRSRELARNDLAAGFTIVDEHYFVSLDDDRSRVFLHARSAHGDQPAGWTRRFGAGRVCVLTPGHTVDVWLNQEYQRVLSRSLGWLAGGPGEVPSCFVSDR